MNQVQLPLKDNERRKYPTWSVESCKEMFLSRSTVISTIHTDKTYKVEQE